ncbi:hypothetical protein OD257_003132 [Clostridioides difficile]|nr:hypothetical protein [Clostridioides difficile]
MNNNNTFDIDVTIVLNEEKNGIELHFNDKASKELREKKEFEEWTKNIIIPKFKRIKKNINASATDNIFDGNTTFAMTMHEYDNFFILKNWGAWRIYFKSGVELYSTKTTETLEDAKKWLIYYLQKNAKKEA